MLDELKTILMYTADHIIMGKGHAAARQFIGFETGETGEYCFHSIADVDLTQFQIANKFANAFDFAFFPSVTNAIDESDFQDLIVFMHGTPKAGGISSGGETHIFMSPDGHCQTVADTALARWKLEFDGGGHTFTGRELALLADMTEGAVRNALADKSENRLHAIPGTKNPVMIEHADALRWLKGRRGFTPFPDRPINDRVLRQQLHATETSEALGQLIRQRLLATHKSMSDVPVAFGWEAADVGHWIAGTQTFDAEKARALAHVLDLDVPLFVGKALEVTLRRDQNRGRS